MKAGLQFEVQKRMPSVSELGPGFNIMRGLFPFPQGVNLVQQVFSGMPLHAVTDHRFFRIEEECEFQPSPQNHLIVEVQSMWKLLKGIRSFTKDVSYSGLDNTMSVVNNPEDGSVTIFNPIFLHNGTQEKRFDDLIGGRKVKHIVCPTRQTSKYVLPYRKMFPNAQFWFSGELPEVVSIGRETEYKDMSCSVLPGRKEPTVELTKDITLEYIAGDEKTHEYVMIHKPLRSLVCTDLFHGPYTDFDPCNTWMCRVWFKLNRDGDHKSFEILPVFRRALIEDYGKPELVVESIEYLAQKYGEEWLTSIVASHGTPPFTIDEQNKKSEAEGGGRLTAWDMLRSQYQQYYPGCKEDRELLKKKLEEQKTEAQKAARRNLIR